MGGIKVEKISIENSFKFGRYASIDHFFLPQLSFFFEKIWNQKNFFTNLG